VSALLAIAGRDAVAERCRRIVGDNLGMLGSEFDERSRFDGRLDADSLDMVCIAMDLEDEFGIAIGDDEAERVETFGALIDLVCAKVAA
jgi:acyl carrier protein